MLSMVDDLELLKIGYKFEKLNMNDNAKKMYTKYVQLVGEFERENVIDLFYGPNLYNSMIVENYDEAINKALVLEKLKELLKMIKDYKTTWNDGNASSVYNNEFVTFINWIKKEKSISTRDISVIDMMIELLKKGVSFNVQYKGSLYHVVRENAKKY